MISYIPLRSLYLLALLPLPTLAQTTRPITHPFTFSGKLQKIDGPNLILLPGLRTPTDASTTDPEPPEITPLSFPTDTIPTDISVNGKHATLADLNPGMNIEIIVFHPIANPPNAPVPPPVVALFATSANLVGTVTRIVGPAITLRTNRPNAPEITLTTTSQTAFLALLTVVDGVVTPTHPVSLADLTPGTLITVNPATGPAQKIYFSLPKKSAP